jgi:hypothetical protein
MYVRSTRFFRLRQQPAPISGLPHLLLHSLARLHIFLNSVQWYYRQMYVLEDRLIPRKRNDITTSSKYMTPLHVTNVV